MLKSCEGKSSPALPAEPPSSSHLRRASANRQGPSRLPCRLTKPNSSCSSLLGPPWWENTKHLPRWLDQMGVWPLKVAYALKGMKHIYGRWFLFQSLLSRSSGWLRTRNCFSFFTLNMMGEKNLMGHRTATRYGYLRHSFQTVKVERNKYMS